MAGATLWLLTAAAVAAFLQAVSHSNPTLPLLPKFLVQLNLLDVNTSATLLVSMVGLLAIRDQYVFSQRPVLGCSILFRELTSSSGEKKDGWICLLHNRGAGPAFLSRITYRMQMPGKRLSPSFEMTFAETLGNLRSMGFSELSDFRMPRMMVGSSIAPGSENILFHASEEVLQRVVILDFRFEYSSFLGYSYQKDIPCIPHERLGRFPPVKMQEDPKSKK